MIRRPLNERFADAVLCGRKITTIRDNPWPIGKPIMLFRWSGKPYRSKQIDIAAVVVTGAISIDISLGDFTDHVEFPEIIGLPRPLWDCEGFNGPMDMNDWFLAKMKPRTTVTKSLMQFRLWTCTDNDRYFDTHCKLP
jgi:hypothetical protein